ncbi:MAG: hypothetical protein PVG71_01205 [Anaerolineae bacterium]|jgi:hypothetical protein
MPSSSCFVHAKDVRLTVLAPYYKGSLADIATKITEAGRLILALNGSEGQDPSSWGCTLKVTDIGKDALLEAVEPLIVEVLDVREMQGLANCTATRFIHLGVGSGAPRAASRDLST